MMSDHQSFIIIANQVLQHLREGGTHLQGMLLAERFAVESNKVLQALESKPAEAPSFDALVGLNGSGDIGTNGVRA